MINSSEYFIFNNKKSVEFNISNVKVSKGLYSEPFLAEREILEINIKNNDTPYFQGIQKRPLQFNVSFYFNDSWDDELIREVAKWLDVDYYKPLQFSENISRTFYCMPINTPEIVHNGLKQGYLTLTFRCNSPYSYSPLIESETYDLSSNGIEGTDIVFKNKGDKTHYPEIFIQKVGSGNIRILNASDNGSEFSLSNLSDQEEIYVNGENEEIESSLDNTWRYDDHNGIFLSALVGVNRLKVYGSCKIKFRSQFKLLA